MIHGSIYMTLERDKILESEIGLIAACCWSEERLTEGGMTELSEALEMFYI